MLFYPGERLALLIDGGNTYGASRALQFDIDYRRMFDHFAGKGVLIRAQYFTTITETEGRNPLLPLLDWLEFLEFNGFTVTIKDVKRFIDPDGRVYVRGSMDVDLAVSAMEMAAHIDHFVICTGDGCQVALVEALQRRGRRVTIVSTIKAAADELRRQADQFIDLAEIRLHIERTHASKVAA